MKVIIEASLPERSGHRFTIFASSEEAAIKSFREEYPKWVISNSFVIENELEYELAYDNDTRDSQGRYKY